MNFMAKYKQKIWSESSRPAWFLFSTVFLYNICLFGFADIAPTRILADSRSSNGENPGLIIPPSETFTSFANMRTVLICSFLIAFLLVIAYYLLSDCPRIIRIISFLIFHLIFFSILFYLSSVGLKSPARLFGLIIQILSLTFLGFVYTLSERPVALRYSGRTTIDRYLRAQWKRVRTGLFVGVAVPFTGAVTFASTTDAGPIPIALLGGIFLMPVVGAAGFYYHRILIAERILGLR